LSKLCTGLIAAVLLVACAGSQTQYAAASPTPTPDPIAKAYVALVHAFWAYYLAAEQNAAVVCLQRVDLQACAERGQAMIPVLQKFQTDLDTTPAPVRFAADDANFRHQLPTAIADLKAAVQAALAKNDSVFTDHINAYVHDMIPIVTGSLDHVDPSIKHV
jgi:hypothetical protein